MRELNRSAWPRIKAKLAASPLKSLFLDFDGTLAPIERTPDEVTMSPKAVDTVARLSRAPGYRVTIISGRSIRDLKPHFPLRQNILFSGNHGLELQGGRLKLPSKAKKAKRHRFLLHLVAQKMSSAFASIPGVIVEDKGVTVSVHYRNVAQQQLPMFTELIHFYRGKFRDYPLLWRQGKKVWEVRPNVHWDKGHTTLFLLKNFFGRNALPIVIGDDQTDEDMFRALRKLGITIRVGYSKKSNAKYYLPSQPDVIDFLQALCKEAAARAG